MSSIIVTICPMTSECTNAIQIERGLQTEFVLERMDRIGWLRRRKFSPFHLDPFTKIHFSIVVV